MAEHPIAEGQHAHPPDHKAARRTWNVIKQIILRTWALAILLVVVWAGYTAVAYLVRTVFKPTPVPAQYRTFETALTGNKLETLRSMPMGVTLPRAPIAHYHTVDRTLPADPQNGCLTSGCHHQLAHTKRKEVRAFANLHASLLECGLCHNADITGPTKAMWVELATGLPSGPPAVLRLMSLFEKRANDIKDKPADVQAEILDLVTQAARVTNDHILEYLRLQISTSEPGSPVWRHAVARLGEELPNHARGEYGVKLAPSAEAFKAYNRHLVEQSKKYLAAAEGSDQREQLYQDIHKGILPKPGACLACHGDDPPRLDFESLGYPPKQAAALRGSEIAHQMNSIQTGQPFYLPKMLEGGNAK